MLQAARSAKKKYKCTVCVNEIGPENTIPTIAFGIEGLSNSICHSVCLMIS